MDHQKCIVQWLTRKRLALVSKQTDPGRDRWLVTASLFDAVRPPAALVKGHVRPASRAACALHRNQPAVSDARYATLGQRLRALLATERNRLPARATRPVASRGGGAGPAGWLKHPSDTVQDTNPTPSENDVSLTPLVPFRALGRGACPRGVVCRRSPSARAEQRQCRHRRAAAALVGI